MLAIARALEGLRRAEAAQLAGLERQARRDAVVRDHAEGARKPARSAPSWSQEKLTAGEQAALKG